MELKDGRSYIWRTGRDQRRYSNLTFHLSFTFLVLSNRKVGKVDTGSEGGCERDTELVTGLQLYSHKYYHLCVKLYII